MIVFWQIVFYLSIFLIFHSYLFFPFILKIKSKGKKDPTQKYLKTDADLPTVSVIMAAYNEVDVIEKKINSVFETNYPPEKLEFLIGSDCSNDGTNELIIRLQEKYKNLYFTEFTERQGKIKIINKLIDDSKHNIIISTDAKVFFEPDTIFHLIEFFRDPEIIIVGGVLRNEQKANHGIAQQEDIFMNREMVIKYREGLIWQQSIGIYGALYAIRRENSVYVPTNLLVDDFYITLKILENKGKVIFSKDAVASENLPVELAEEFRRKVRIATGNFQNLRIFSKLLLTPYKSLSFAFISHKVIRWLTPFIFVLTLISNIFLLDIFLYKLSLLAIILIFILPILDFILKKMKINIGILRLITHYISMNIALVFGFFKAVKGVKSSTWQPSKRN